MTEEILQQLIDIVLNTAPELWRIATKQVLINGVKSALFTVVSMVAVYVSIRAVRWGHAHWSDDNANTEVAAMFATTAGAMGVLIACIVTVFAVSDSISYLLNPEYYAIQVLMNLVK